ncbi:hypothetical protein C4K18_3535 [Pseudomonas chlororaphis subsp. aurantiaca]|nr:hypothetical protein C4K18_3535 [Pseudomonas chlororaphis subsp. aurantiaca]
MAQKVFARFANTAVHPLLYPWALATGRSVTALLCGSRRLP